MGRVARRGVLAGAAGATLAAAAGAQPAPDRRAAFAALRLGANIERWFAIAAENRPRRLGRAWWEGFRAAGFDHARLFIPRDAGTGEEVPRLFLQAVQDANAAGLPVFLALEDLFDANEPWPEATFAAVRARARLFGAATDPARVVLAPLNEPAFPDPASWTPMRDRLLALVRAEAPRHLLMWGGHEWCSWRSLLPQRPPADPDTLAEVHDYVGGDAAAVRWRFGQVAEWARRHGTPALVAELGGALPHAADHPAWAADLSRALPVLRGLGLPATLWAVTHGGHWRLQEGENPFPRPVIATALRG